MLILHPLTAFPYVLFTVRNLLSLAQLLSCVATACLKPSVCTGTVEVTHLHHVPCPWTYGLLPRWLQPLLSHTGKPYVQVYIQNMSLKRIYASYKKGLWRRMLMTVNVHRVPCLHRTAWRLCLA